MGEGQTRRRFLQAGAGAALGLAGAGTGVLGEAIATAAKATDTPSMPGELKLFAGDYVPAGYLGCKGQNVQGKDHPKLADAIKKRWGGNEAGEIGLPDLRSRAAVGAGSPPGWPQPLEPADYGQALATASPDNDPSSLGMTYLINPGSPDRVLVGEVRAFAFPSVPRNWLPCDGSVLRINHHLKLFSIIGTFYGGDRRDTFAVPDLRSATPIGHGDPPKLPKTPFAEPRNNLAAGGTERRPRLHVNYCIAREGDYPDRV